MLDGSVVRNFRFILYEAKNITAKHQHHSAATNFLTPPPRYSSHHSHSVTHKKPQPSPLLLVLSVPVLSVHQPVFCIFLLTISSVSYMSSVYFLFSFPLSAPSSPPQHNLVSTTASLSTTSHNCNQKAAKTLAKLTNPRHPTRQSSRHYPPPSPL